MEESKENKKGKKKWLLLLIALAILILGGIIAFAADKVYVDSHGNKLGGTSNGWEASSKNCGARISIVDKTTSGVSTKAGPRDFYSSSDLGDMVEYTMGGKNKFQVSGADFEKQKFGYDYAVLDGLPQTCGSGVNKEAIVEFLKEPDSITAILLGLGYSDAPAALTEIMSKGYYLIIEPIAIFTCDPDESDDDFTVYNLACTATEVADYDSHMSAHPRPNGSSTPLFQAKIPSVAYVNLPNGIHVTGDNPLELTPHSGVSDKGQAAQARPYMLQDGGLGIGIRSFANVAKIIQFIDVDKNGMYDVGTDKLIKPSDASTYVDAEGPADPDWPYCLTGTKHPDNGSIDEKNLTISAILKGSAGDTKTVFNTEKLNAVTNKDVVKYNGVSYKLSAFYVQTGGASPKVVAPTYKENLDWNTIATKGYDVEANCNLKGDSGNSVNFFFFIGYSANTVTIHYVKEGTEEEIADPNVKTIPSPWDPKNGPWLRPIPDLWHDGSTAPARDGTMYDVACTASATFAIKPRILSGGKYYYLVNAYGDTNLTAPTISSKKDPYGVAYAWLNFNRNPNKSMDFYLEYTLKPSVTTRYVIIDEGDIGKTFLSSRFR